MTLNDFDSNLNSRVELFSLTLEVNIEWEFGSEKCYGANTGMVEVNVKSESSPQIDSRFKGSSQGQILGRTPESGKIRIKFWLSK